MITFGRSLDEPGNWWRRRATISVPRNQCAICHELAAAQLASVFRQSAYEDLAQDIPEQKIRRLAQLGGGASRFGKSIAQVADITSSTVSGKELSAASRQFALTAGAISEAANGVFGGCPRGQPHNLRFPQDV